MRGTEMIFSFISSLPLPSSTLDIRESTPLSSLDSVWLGLLIVYCLWTTIGSGSRAEFSRWDGMLEVLYGSGRAVGESGIILWIGSSVALLDL
jgi:hypothetical protein